jgi:hypothetical protein
MHRTGRGPLLPFVIGSFQELESGTLRSCRVACFRPFFVTEITDAPAP